MLSQKKKMLNDPERDIFITRIQMYPHKGQVTRF